MDEASGVVYAGHTESFRVGLLSLLDASTPAIPRSPPDNVTFDATLDRVHVFTGPFLFSSHFVEYLTSSHAPIHPDPSYSVFEAGEFSDLNAAANRVYYGSQFGDVTFLDATTGAYALWGRSCRAGYQSYTTGDAPSAVAVMPTRPRNPGSD